MALGSGLLRIVTVTPSVFVYVPSIVSTLLCDSVVTSVGAPCGQVAAVSRQVALLERQLDDAPSRAEIAQYQKRFVELYNQGEAAPRRVGANGKRTEHPAPLHDI